MSKEQTSLELNAVEITEAVQTEMVSLDDLSLALVGGGNFVVTL